EAVAPPAVVVEPDLGAGAVVTRVRRKAAVGPEVAVPVALRVVRKLADCLAVLLRRMRDLNSVQRLEQAGEAPDGRLRVLVPVAAWAEWTRGYGVESWILGAVICLYCWLFSPVTSDLAAAAFRSDLFAHDGLLIYNAQWYEGHHMLAYSLLSPVFGAVLGTRL